MKKLLGLFLAFLASPAFAIDLKQTDEGSAQWVPGFGMPGVYADTNGIRQVTNFSVGPSVIAIRITQLSTASTYFGIAPRAGRLVEAFVVNDGAGMDSSKSLISISIGHPTVNSTGTYTPVTTSTLFHPPANVAVAGGVGAANFRNHTGSTGDTLAVRVSHGWPVSAATSGASSGQGSGMVYIIIE